MKCVGPLQDTPNLVVSQAVTIDCSLGAGAIHAQNITINAPGKRIKLQNLSVDALAAFFSAIVIQAADSVILENVVLRGAGGSAVRDIRTGPAKLVIRNSTIDGNGLAGIVIAPASGLIGVTIDNVLSTNNAYGLAVGSGGRVMISRSVFTWNANAGIEADPGAVVIIDGSQVSFNSIGLQSAGGSMQVSNSGILSNSTAVSGSVQSYGNNRVAANSSDGAPLSPAGGTSSENGQR